MSEDISITNEEYKQYHDKSNPTMICHDEQPLFAQLQVYYTIVWVKSQ